VETGHRVVTRSATIHAKPTVPATTEPARSAADADVRIIMRETRVAVLKPRPGTSPAPSRHNEPGSIDRLEYAAYRDLVEEASVEIVTALVQEDAAADTEAASKNPPAAEKRPGGAETGKVRRFLEALTGD
jgi:hypothetical protein